MCKKYFLLALSAVVVTASCKVGKPYSRADLQVPEQYRQGPAALTGDTVLLPWKTFFRDPVLGGLIEKALDKNNDLGVALLTVKQLDLAYQQARLGLMPALDLTVSASRNYLSKNSLNGSLSNQFIGTNYLDDYTASLRLSWEADIWGKAKMTKSAALANYFAQKENLSALRTRIIAQVAQAYYNLLTLDEQLTVARRNVALSDSTLQMIQLQYRSGQVTSLGVEQAAAQKKTAELLVPLAQQQIAIQENALSILCGSYPDVVARAAGLATSQLEEVFPTGVPALLLSRRPDVKAAEYAVVAANARTGLARAALYPTITLSPAIGTNSFKINSWFDLPGSVVKNVAVGITQPIFYKKSLKTAYEIAVIEQQKAGLQFRQSMLTAVGEVSDALATGQYANERLVLAGEKKATLEKATKDALLLYKSGMATYLEVITAQNNALQNALEEISIRREKLVALVDLYRALGGGLE